MDKIVEHWIERSQYDLDTARVMLDSGRYLYVSYMCQQSVEKLLKAIIAQQGKENFPIHNLNRLAEISAISDELSSEKQKAQQVYKKTLEIHKWLYLKIK
jgi:HEPN domain-containing protein